MRKKGEMPENFEESLRPHCFKKGQTGNPNGRPKNRIPNLLKECIGKNKAELCEELNDVEINAIEKVMMTLGIKELQAVAKKEETPAYMKTLAMAAILDMKQGRTKVMDLLRDRQYGAVKKQVDVTTNGMSMNQTTLTPKEARDMLNDIEREY